MEGRPKEVCDDCLLRCVAHGDAPVSSTTEVSDRANLTKQAIRDRLHDLVAHQYLQTDNKSQTRLWWLTDIGQFRLEKGQCSCEHELYL